jgi:predicted Zn-dependent peptidase
MIEKTVERADAGLRFHILKTDRFKMSRLSFNFILPADEERSPRTKLMLATMMRGCTKYPTVVAINKRLDELYGATVTWRATAVGERHVFRISCEVLGDRYRFGKDEESIVKSVAEVIAEILFNPLTDQRGLLSESNFESERKLAIDAVKAKINDQKAYAAERCKNLMLKGNPAGISVEGSIEQLEKMTLREISENIDYFLKNSVFECYYVGGDDVLDVVDFVSEKFASIGRGSPELRGAEHAFLREDCANIRHLDESVNASQCRLNIGLTGGAIMRDKDYYACVIFNEIFGGSSVAKLFMNVREKQSLCYYCYSSYGSATGTLMIGCGIKGENREKAYAEIEKQLSAMQCGDFTDEEVETAKKTGISGLMQISDSPSAIEAFEFRRFLAGICETPEQAAEGIGAVSKDDIVSAANKIRISAIYFLEGTGEEDDYE